MSRVIAILACGLCLAACSTSISSLSFLKSSPTSEALRIESEPPGAEAKTSLGQTCRTPCELTVQPAGEMTVTLALSGYQSQTITLRPEVPGGDPDVAPRLAPNPIYAELAPVPSGSPAKKSPAKKKSRPQTAAARPAPSASASAATTAPATTATTTLPTPPAAAAAPAAPTESAPSATQYPWPSR
ncbi:MAG: PEGA domain-containing protein [Xanthobacteraceae bacterium]